MTLRATNLRQLPDLQTIAQGVQHVAQNGGLNNPLAATLKSISFSSRYTPPVTYTGQQLMDSWRDPTPNPYLQKLQPVVVIDTAFGRQVIAPYGQPKPDEWRGNVGEVGALTVGAFIGGLGLSFLAGLALARWRFGP